MHIHVHGQSPSTRVFAYRSRITGELTEFYPEQGLITIEGAHYRTGAPYYKREPRREFLLRAAALSLEVRRMRYGDERRDLQRCLAVMVQVARIAGAQGDPFNPRHMDDMIKAPPVRTVHAGPGFVTPVAPLPRAPEDKPVVLLGGEVTTPERIIVVPSHNGA